MEIIAYAFGIGAFVVAAIAALFGVIHYRDATIWTTCVAVVLALIGGFCWLQDREWKKDAAVTATATPTLAPDRIRAVPPTHGPRFGHAVDKVRIVFGGNELRLTNVNGPLRVTGQNTPDSVTAEIANGELLINAKLYSGAELQGNKVKNLPADWDFNFDENALEIVNENGNPVFQLQYVGANIATVNGIFRKGAGSWIFAKDNEVMEMPATMEQAAKEKMPAMFRYPAKSYPGERTF